MKTTLLIAALVFGFSTVAQGGNHQHGMKKAEEGAKKAAAGAKETANEKQNREADEALQKMEKMKQEAHAKTKDKKGTKKQ